MLYLEREMGGENEKLELKESWGEFKSDLGARCHLGEIPKFQSFAFTFINKIFFFLDVS